MAKPNRKRVPVDLKGDDLKRFNAFKADELLDADSVAILKLVRLGLQIHRPARRATG